MNKENMDTVIDLGSSKVKISTFDQKKKLFLIFRKILMIEKILKKSQV